MRFLFLVCQVGEELSVLFGGYFCSIGSQVEGFHLVPCASGYAVLSHDHVGKSLATLNLDSLNKLRSGFGFFPEFFLLAIVLFDPVQMFNDVVDSEEIRPDESLPNVVMVVVIGPEAKVDDIDKKSFNNNGHNKIADKNFMVGSEVGVEENEEQEEELDEDEDDHIVDIDLVVVLSLFDLEKWFFEYEVDQIGHVEKNYQNQLDYRVSEGYHQENCSYEFMEIADERERKLPGSYFGLYGIGEDQ